MSSATQQLYLIGTGPGAADLLTPRASNAIAKVSDVVAYGLYLDLLGEQVSDKTHHSLPLGEEVGRARLALDLAASGKPTALLSSGDIGIFAMATLVFELLDQHPEQGEQPWQDVEIEVIPGISALQAAASTAGALLGHDFCAISLSDLLTPWETIETRIKHAAAADFVVNFYNPVSKKRHWQLAKAKEILLQHRPADTPVLVGRNLSRVDQRMDIITLEQLDVSMVDMFTLVAVGNSESRRFQHQQRQWAYTPRGYSRKLS